MQAEYHYSQSQKLSLAMAIASTVLNPEDNGAASVRASRKKMWLEQALPSQVVAPVMKSQNNERWIRMFKNSRLRKSWLERRRRVLLILMATIFQCSYGPSTVQKTIYILFKINIVYFINNIPCITAVELSPFQVWENQGSESWSNLSR